MPIKNGNKIAMTGELANNGEVTAVGGVKAKILAAVSANMQTVFVPAQNHKETEKLGKKVSENIKIVFVEQFEDILSMLFPEVFLIDA